MHQRSSPYREGFTLVELLVVIGVIATLIAMLLPVLSRARIAAAQLQCSSNQRQIAMAIMYYAQEHSGYCPIALYQHGPDDFSTGSYWTTWYNRYGAGQYMKVITRGKDFNPSSFTEGYTTKYDPAVSFLYCTAYTQHTINSDIGIGVNIRSGAYLFTTSTATQHQRKLASVRHPTQLPMLVDVASQFVWEKSFANEGYPYNGQPNSATIAYRHGRSSANAVVTFCDGHGEAFLNDKPQQSNPGYLTGINAAINSGTVVSAWNK